MAHQDIVNKAAQPLIDSGCDMVSIITTWQTGETSKCLMMVPKKSEKNGGDEQMAATKKKPASKKKPAAKMPGMPGKGMGRMGGGKY